MSLDHIATPPGDTLLELINEIGMNRKTLAAQLGKSIHWTYRFLGGTDPRRAHLDVPTALKLERLLKVQAHFWLSLEMNYRLALARKKFKK